MARRRLTAIRKLAGFGLLAVLAVSAVGFYQQRDIPRDRAPLLAGKTIGGHSLNLQQMTAEDPVLIYFWATWCGYCRVVSPAVSDLSAKHQVVSVALQSGNDEELLAYQDRHGLEFPTINDPTGALSQAWGIRVTPTIVIVGSDGRVAWATSGTTSKWGLQLRLALTN